ncbi:alpha/beta fold hydrolase [Microcoleus sp. herbarium19]|uniref:alpha/beta fold hydrolase n=1 Tax=unclassified Microcoleus TaxID=2642155 RepID=UPI002FD350B2
MKIRYGFRQVGDVEVFYREAGASDAPVILLLHGFPTASHMFRDLIPLLADRFRLVAPDLPGFGQTKAPPRGTFDYRFDRLADVIEGFVDALSSPPLALSARRGLRPSKSLRTGRSSRCNSSLRRLIMGCTGAPQFGRLSFQGYLRPVSFVVRLPYLIKLEYLTDSI